MLSLTVTPCFVVLMTCGVDIFLLICFDLCTIVKMLAGCEKFAMLFSQLCVCVCKKHLHINSLICWNINFYIFLVV